MVRETRPLSGVPDDSSPCSAASPRHRATETATMQNPTTTMDILTRLRVKRIGLSLDDFGTGYSSLTQLYQMPFKVQPSWAGLVM